MGVPQGSQAGVQQGAEAGVQANPKGVLQAGAKTVLHQGAKAGVPPSARGDMHPILPVPSLRTANLWQVDPKASPYHLHIRTRLMRPAIFILFICKVNIHICAMKHTLAENRIIYKLP